MTNLEPTSVFVTSKFTQETEDGNVSRHQAKALARVTKIEKIITNNDFVYEFVESSGVLQPFILDYLTANELKNHRVDLALFNGLPFGMTMHVLKPAKTIITVTPNNTELSLEEYKNQNRRHYHATDYITKPPLFDIYSKYLQNADVILCPSKQSAKYISAKFPSIKSMAVIPYGCNPSKNSQIDTPNDFSIAHVGVNSPDNGQFYLIQAWHKMKQDPTFKGQLVMAGHGTKFWRPFKVNCFEHVRDIKKLFNKCSVYVQPSVTEGFGINVLEAMSFARPVIVTEGAGVSELVDEGKDGFIVPIRDSKIIKEKIEYLYENPKTLKKMGKNARIKAEKYTWKIMEEKTQKLIQEILNV
ncbi:MAG: glycosyltransferase [Clostridiales bacterium]|nr:glycosyltransferase [Clostridiales bacterium]